MKKLFSFARRKLLLVVTVCLIACAIYTIVYSPLGMKPSQAERDDERWRVKLLHQGREAEKFNSR
jgi:hypothetical protein